ncbi:MAG: polysaccharide ABC transporter ATP-binding protein [Syntrophobacteraceae bacterium]
MSAIITVENLSKAYRIGLKDQVPDTLMSAAAKWIKSPLTNFRDLRRLNTFDHDGETEDIIWALKDVSFEVQEGEAVGIIGRNGAGKSTLLKVLSRITEPTGGRAVIRGRISSLLEVGTGFHPDLTGRENIYMNGTILGMTKREIDGKFDEIVDFSGVERFLDTPIKRYSSGMQVRLAFSVAAHLEPEILIIDEVLAVGDAEFQKKCLGKMEDVANLGRTVLFVSHQLGAIQRLCSRSIVMQEGHRIFDGLTTEAIGYYLSSHSPVTSADGWTSLTNHPRHGSGEAKFVGYQCIPVGCPDEHHLYSDEPVEINLLLHSESTRTVGNLCVTFYDRVGTKLVNADTGSLGRSLRLQQGENAIRIRIDKLHLKPGPYNIGFWLANPPHVFDHIEVGGTVEVIDRESQEFGYRPDGDGVVTCSLSVIELTNGVQNPSRPTANEE